MPELRSGGETAFVTMDASGVRFGPPAFGGAAPLGDSDRPTYLLNGRYGVSAMPEMGRELAEVIGAAHFEVMRGVGHFPMSENPEAFRGYLLPVLDRILALPVR